MRRMEASLRKARALRLRFLGLRCPHVHSLTVLERCHLLGSLACFIVVGAGFAAAPCRAWPASMPLLSPVPWSLSSGIGIMRWSKPGGHGRGGRPADARQQFGATSIRPIGDAMVRICQCREKGSPKSGASPPAALKREPAASARRAPGDALARCPPLGDFHQEAQDRQARRLQQQC